MSDFNAKMQQIRFQLVLYPRTCYVNLQRGRPEGQGWRQGEGKFTCPIPNSWICHCFRSNVLHMHRS